MRVLLTDDSMTIRMILKNLLNEMGITDITEGRNGQEALDILEESQFDLVLTDIHMPKVDGLTVLETIKTGPDAKHRYVPVVVISSDTDYRQIERARDLGAFGYIKKPFKRKSLEEAIRAAQEAEDRRKSQEAIKNVADVSNDVDEVVKTSSEPKNERPPAESQPVGVGTVAHSDTSPIEPKRKGGLLGWMRKIFSK